MRGDIFEILKLSLKARGLTYADLAERMQVSEPTVKRIFATRDAKLSRLVQICEVLDLALDDVVAQADRIDLAPKWLTPEQEARLGADPAAFYLFILLREDMSAEQIARHFDMPEIEVFRIGQRLERLGLAEVQVSGRIKITLDRPVKFRRDGPLHGMLRDLNMRFIAEVFGRTDTDHAGFVTASRRASPATARKINAELAALHQRFTEMARQDQVALPDQVLTTVKLAAAFGPVDFAKMIDLSGQPPRDG